MSHAAHITVTRPPRVRIAPSPTGDPHIGTAYMGLFNLVFARKHGGKFLLRIEDTDQTRYRKMSEDQILSALRWAGITWDEGPDVGGPFGPYKQSERLPLYRSHAEKLLAAGKAYRCFCSSERLEEVRKAQLEKKENPGYDRHCRELSPGDAAARASQGTAHTIRLKVPTTGATRVLDGLRGEVDFENSQLDDLVLLKSDGFPTYHLASVVDDHHMQITHVIRGEEWLSSTPKHVLLYAAFEWEAPQFLHMPLLRNPDRSKISKRKNPTSILYYQRKGILPEAFRNYLALMGWSLPPGPSGEEREQFSTAEMIEQFTWDRMSLGGPVFDVAKLTWLNGKYLHQMDTEGTLQYLRQNLLTDERLRAVIPLVRDRIESFEQFMDASAFFFSGDLDYTGKPIPPKGVDPQKASAFLLEVLDRLEMLEEWTAPEIQKAIEAFVKASGLKTKDVYMTLRVAVSGTMQSPDLMKTLEVLGKEMVRRRTRQASEFLATLTPTV
jgi:glutamyl-tRNA synthetase